ncbi:ArsR/SmtB family transcription factor [Pseudoduganella buxea]|uniref:Helix-turn-helix domain-containing protein n=1 Tax=Pseudoduganella buxea TaxID=1949069 RepID=A0A6I3T6P5_9BURK|nr:helix-turn-helix transcriptional regulator [Pseudoduganella buxea]MTV55167.1 helix-turn-helix domain-containing protein [Pseudoduganella buxea]GGC20866.1 transcriptional regulator [Pseudoduganella buxea]
MTELDIDAIHKALANPVRRQILAWLKEPEVYFARQLHPVSLGVCASMIDQQCGLSQSTVSGHLAILQKAGLITVTRLGQWNMFRRNEDVIQGFREHINLGL